MVVERSRDTDEMFWGTERKVVTSMMGCVVWSRKVGPQRCSRESAWSAEESG